MKPIKEKAKAFKYGKTVASILATGRTIKQMAKADSSMPMVTFMKVIGSMISLMVVECTNTEMELNTLEIGTVIVRMDMVLRFGQTNPCTKATMKKVGSMVLEYSGGVMGLPILANFIIIISMAKELTNGLIIDSTLASGGQIRCTVRVPSYGPMAASILVSIKMIRNMASANSFG